MQVKIAMIIRSPFKGLLMLLCSLLLSMPKEYTPPTHAYPADPPQGRPSQHQDIEEESDETGGLLHMPWRGPVQPGQVVKAAVRLY